MGGGVNEIRVARLSTSTELRKLHTRRRRFLKPDFNPVDTCKRRKTVIRCDTSRGDGIPLGRKGLFVASAKNRCLRKSASVAHAITLKRIKGVRGRRFALMTETVLHLTGAMFLCKYDNTGLSYVTERIF